MADKPIRHRYPIWLAWPLEIAAFLLIVFATWSYLLEAWRVVFQQWPHLLDNLGAFPGVRTVVLNLLGTIPNAVPWEELYGPLVQMNVRAFLLFLVAALIRNFLPRLRPHEQGLQVRRGLGWATIPWDRITLVNSMALPGDRLVLLVQGRRWRLGPWFRFYSLLWGGGLRKGVVVAWHIREFDTLADELVAHLTEIYGEHDIALVIDDTAYSLLYALLFLPAATWRSLFADQEVHRDAYAHSKWVRALTRTLSAVLLILAIWRYLGVWWRFLASRFDVLMGGLHWPVIGTLLSTFGPRDATLSESQAYLGLLAGQINMILVLTTIVFILNLFPDWLLGAEGLSAYVRRRWMAINWPDIYAIRETIFADGRGVILLQVKRACLTFWHRLYSLAYGAGLRRGVLFSSVLIGFEDLRQRIHLGVIRARESDPSPAERPILVEHGEAEFLQMLREPRATLRRWGKREKPEEDRGGLLKRMQAYTPTLSTDLPWEGEDREWLSIDQEEVEEKERTELGPAIRAAITLAVFGLVLILLEQVLFPTLSRPLALFALPPLPPDRGPVVLLLKAVLMGVLVLGEWPLMALFFSMVAEMYEQPGEFRRVLSLYSRMQSPRLALALLLLLFGVTGIIQPLFFLWCLGGMIWGAALVWLAGREFYGWPSPGNAFVLIGFVVYQILVLLAYLFVR